MVGPDGKDCGLTQTRVTITKYSCKQLRRSYGLAFQEAAREMKEYGAACRGHADYDRCRLNHYNSGVRYARRGFHGAYWLRVHVLRRRRAPRRHRRADLPARAEPGRHRAHRQARHPAARHAAHGEPRSRRRRRAPSVDVALDTARR